MPKRCLRMGAKSGGFKDAEHDCFRYHDRTKFYPNQPPCFEDHAVIAVRMASGDIRSARPILHVVAFDR